MCQQIRERSLDINYYGCYDFDQTRPDQTRPDHSCPKIQQQKVLIVTFYGSNYGTCLQNFALKTVIASLGFDVVNLRSPTRKSRFVSIATLKNAVKHVLAALGVKKYRDKLMIQKLWNLRSKKFQSFYEKYNNSEIRISLNEVLDPINKNIWDGYAYVVVGSDMVWGYFTFHYTPKSLQYYYLTFVDREKRVSYAPSFGRAEFTFEFPELRKEYLAGFNKISCREARGCETIKRVTGFNAVHVLDPAMLLTAEDYKPLERKPSYAVPGHYALLYTSFEGLSDARICEYNHVITRTCNGRKTINLALKCLESDIGYSPEVVLSSTGPEEFLWLIDHSDIVLTNSFHCTAFSILFKKSFITFHRGNTADTSKVEDILLTLGLSSRMYNNDGIIPAPEIDYSAVYEKLAALRESSMNYLKDCLHVN